MDYGTNAVKQVLQNILQNIAPSHANLPLIGQINQLLAAPSIKAVHYSYNVPFYVPGANNAIAAGATANAQLSIQNDAPFMVINTVAYKNKANDNSAIGQPTNALILINDSGSGANLMDQQMPIQNLFGSAQLPYVWPEPRVFAANATLQHTVTNTDTTDGMNLWLTYNGVKLYQGN